MAELELIEDPQVIVIIDIQTTIPLICTILLLFFHYMYQGINCAFFGQSIFKLTPIGKVYMVHMYRGVIDYTIIYITSIKVIDNFFK